MTHPYQLPEIGYEGLLQQLADANLASAGRARRRARLSRRTHRGSRCFARGGA